MMPIHTNPPTNTPFSPAPKKAEIPTATNQNEPVLSVEAQALPDLPAVNK